MGGESGAAERFRVWLLTGPLGRIAAFTADAAVLWWRWARARLAERLRASGSG